MVNVHHFSGQIIEAIEANKGWGSEIIISDESDEVLETGGGLKKAAPHLLMETFVLMNVDILTTLDLGAMIAFHQKLLPLATLAVTSRTTSRYFLFDHLHNLCGWKNVKTGEERIVRQTADALPKAFSGIHIIEPRIFQSLKQEGKFSMVEVYLSLAGQDIIKGFDHTGTAFIDVGKPEAAAAAEALFT